MDRTEWEFESDESGESGDFAETVGSGQSGNSGESVDFSANKSNCPASEQILLEMPMEEQILCACVGQNKSTLWIIKQAAHTILFAHTLLEH